MTTRTVIAPNADIRETPDANAVKGKLETQLVFGEGFIVDNEEGNWAQGRCAHDDYPGWIEKRFLGDDAAPATHIITAARSSVYRADSMKSPCVGVFSFGSRVSLRVTGEKWSQLSSGAWIYTKHLSPVAEKFDDHLATAKKFLETPYYWGGRSGFGIDCSGLVQVSLALAGIKAPRDTEQQITLGASTPRSRTGDLVFFPGHVGIMVDEDNILHANAFHMKVAVEPLWVVEERSKGITDIRRLG
ncbi:MAG: peptidase [Alphaproteobacteria bacterium]|jgi:cell wall-associated NlpC family hydrolase|nr:peptidase [Alphaproteobacteria bacterium]